MRQRNAEPKSAASGPSVRHTLCGEPAAEARVAQDLSRLGTGIDSEVGDVLRALVLLGPFARAEGGIRLRGGEPCAADPGYEVLALVRHAPQRQQRPLTMMAATWARLLHARVVIRAIALDELRGVPNTRPWFHAARGQALTLAGNPTLLSAIPSRPSPQLRWDEPLFALCEALAPLALCGLEAPDDAAAAVAPLQRAVLACGDALLLQRGLYAETLAARAAALDAARASATLRAAYSEAIAWSSRPDRWQPHGASLSAWVEDTRRALADRYLEQEAWRVGSARKLLRYVLHREPLYAEPGTGRHGRLAGALSRWSGAPAWAAQPRERLLRASVALAFAPRSPVARAHAARLLRVKSAPHALLPAEALAQALRVLAQSALDDGLGHPFAGLRAAGIERAG